MKCPFCFMRKAKLLILVQQMKEKESDGVECLKCGKRFTTYEIIETVPVIVIKEISLVRYLTEVKILSGLLRACENVLYLLKH